MAGVEQNPIVLIAHRGGVVEGRHPENSSAALDEAVMRGFAGVEIDVRVTSDGECVCYHDTTVANGFDRRERVADLSLRELRGKVGSWVLTLAEMLARCAGRVRVMLDVKESRVSGDVFARIERSLEQFGLLDGAWIIGTAGAKSALADHAATTVSVNKIKRGERRMEQLSEREFIFGHGTELDDSFVRSALERDVLLIPSINRFHYLPELEPAGPAGRDIRRLLELGVRVFQIDSEFAQFFPGFHL